MVKYSRMGMTRMGSMARTILTRKTTSRRRERQRNRRKRKRLRRRNRAHGTMHTHSRSHPVCKLSRRAHAFSDILSRASSTCRAIPTDGNASSRSRRSIVEDASRGKDHEEEEELCFEHPRDVVTHALLQELFFPRTESVNLVSSGTGSLADTSFVSLNVNVGKLQFWRPLNGAIEACILAVRAIRSDTSEVGCFHEQCIYTRADEVTRDNAVFDHHFKIFVNIPPDVLISNTCNERKMLEATVHFVARAGEPILRGTGYLYLWDIISQTSFTHETHIVLVGSEIGFENNIQDQGYDPSKFRARDRVRRQTSDPLGILELGLKIDRPLSASCPTISEISEESWLYAYVHIDKSVMQPENLNQNLKSLTLIIKSGNHSAVRFISMNSDLKSCGLIPTLGDVIVKAPNLSVKAVIYIEIWCNNNISTVMKFHGLENLCGLLKVPLPAMSNGLKSRLCENIVDGDFLLWHSQSGVKEKKVRITIYMGQKRQMLNVLKETRAAVTIQRHSRYFLERLRNLNSSRRTKDLLAKHGMIQRDVFEVTVLRAKNIPVDVLTRNDSSTIRREVFITYIFPGEDEPLFTHDIELEQTITFGATAHHRITLPQGRSIFEYLESLDEEKSCIKFELWTYISVQDSEVQTQSEYHYRKLKYSSGRMRRNRKPRVKQKEKCFGIAELLLKDLLDCFKLGSRRHLALKVTRSFDLPIRFHKWVKVHASAKLIVQISYENFDLPEKRLLEDSIFSIYATGPTSSVFPLKATLDVLILDVVMQDTLKPIKHPPNWSIRLSLFPFHQELQRNYPPLVKTWTKESRHLQFKINVVVDAWVIKEMQQSFMTLEVSKHPVKQSLSSTSFQEDFWVGVSMVPCLMLISQKQGMSKEIELTGRSKQKIGVLKVRVKLIDINN